MTWIVPGGNTAAPSGRLPVNPGFVHTVLVDMGARLARSARPDRIFGVTLEVGNNSSRDSSHRFFAFLGRAS